MIPEDMPALSSSDYEITGSTPDAHEQLMVELINRARLDPTAEIALSGDGIAPGLSSEPVQALAVVPELDTAAQAHSTDMEVNDYFAHNSQNGDSPFDRMRDAGYNFRSAGENISWSSRNEYSERAITGHHERLWASDGHQSNILNAGFSEIGVGYASGASGNYLTQNFGDRGVVYLTGVVIDDADGDLFYDVGEGQGEVRITAYNDETAVGTSTWDAGGYSLALDPGTYTVVFEGGDLDGSFVTEVTIGTENVKLDVIEDRDAVQDTPAPEPVTEPEPEPVAELDPQPEPEPIPDPVPAPEPMPEPEPDPVVVPEPEPVAEPEPEPTPDPEPEPVAEPEPEPIADPEPAPEPEPIADPEPAPEPEPIADPEPTPEPEPIADPEPAPEPEPIADPEPAPEPEPIADPEPAPEPEPIADPEPAPEPEPEPAPETPTIVAGDDGINWICGSDESEIFVTGAGRIDLVFSGGGEDMFVFGDETTNGRCDIEVIWDFDVESDQIALEDGIDGVAWAKTSRRGDLVLKLEGDGDKVVLRGVDGADLDDLTFAQIPDDLLA